MPEQVSISLRRNELPERGNEQIPILSSAVDSFWSKNLMPP